jgi:two-component system response regulator RegA
MPQKILIVEDNEDSRRMYTRLLEDAGHSVRAVGSVSQAIEEMTNEPPDWALVDLNLPDGPGTEVQAFIAQNELRTHVAVMTGYSGMELDAAEDYYPEAVFVKPVAFDVLIRVLEQQN